MSASEYLENVIEKKGISLEKLAEEINVTPPALYNIRKKKNGLSRNMIKKLSDYLSEKPEKIMYKSLADRYCSRLVDENSLLYLCEKFFEDNVFYCRTKFEEFPFCGAYHSSKSSSIGYSLVDGWNTLEQEFLESQFKISKGDFLISREKYSKELYLDEDTYYRAILRFGIMKAIKAHNNRNVSKYDIIFNDDKIISKIKDYVFELNLFEINLILKPIESELSYNKLVKIDDDDYEYFVDIFNYTHGQYYWKNEIPSDELWICAFECNKEIIPYVKPSIGYQGSKLIRDDYKLLMENEEKEFASDEWLARYLDRKIEFLKNGKRNELNLDYLEYSIILRPIKSTLDQAEISIGEYKKILKILKPLIDDYYNNYDRSKSYPRFID